MVLQVPLLLGGVDAGQVHPVEPAVLLSLVPVGLQGKVDEKVLQYSVDDHLKKYPEIVFLLS